MGLTRSAVVGVIVAGAAAATAASPFDALFGPTRSGAQNASVTQTQFFRRMFAESSVDVALFLDRGVPSSPSPSSSSFDAQHHIFLPFLGGPDDRLALAFVAQLCLNASVRATAVRVTTVDADDLTPVNSIVDAKQIDHGHVSVSSLPPLRFFHRVSGPYADRAFGISVVRRFTGDVP